MPQNPNIGSLAGTWTYRSFLSDPNLATPFNNLEFGRGNIRSKTRRWACSRGASSARAGGSI